MLSLLVAVFAVACSPGLSTGVPTPTSLPAAYWSVEPIAPGSHIEKIEVAGTYEQIGFAFGGWYQERGYLPRPLTADEQEIGHGMLALYQEIQPGVGQQARGIYAAYGLNVDELTEAIPIAEDAEYRHLLPGLVEDKSCSVAYVRPEMSLDGHARLGRNHDFPTAEPDTALVFTYPEGDYATVTLAGGAPNFTASDGLNSQGLALGLASVDRAGYQPPAGPAITPNSAYRIVLETCATVEEAIARLQEMPIAFVPQGGTHVLLADRSGASAVVEFLPEGVVVSRADAPYQVMTNSHWAGPANQPDCERYQVATGLLDGKQGQMDTESLMNVLSEIQWSAQWTVVYDLNDLTITLSLPDDEYTTRYEFSLADFIAHIEAN
jgi:hypothetical protein